MKFGVCVPNYGTTSSVEGISAVAVEAERLGYDSVWTTDHILMSRNSGTPYERIFDSISSLGYLAAKTKKVKLGISCLIIAMRNPAAVAKQLATIDAFSDGRVVLGVGVGWNEREFINVGSNFHDRGKRVNASIRLLRSLWEGKTSFQSRYLPLRAEDTVFDPKPASKHLEVWIGGTSEAAMKRALNLGDAWHPNVMPIPSFRKMLQQYDAVSKAPRKKKPICVRVGLDISAEKAEYMGVQGDRRLRLTGDMDHNAKLISELEELGVSYAVVVPSPEGRTSTRHQLESVNAFGERFLK